MIPSIVKYRNILQQQLLNLWFLSSYEAPLLPLHRAESFNIAGCPQIPLTSAELRQTWPWL